MTERITLSCHCGGTRIAVPSAPTHATQCNCTYCTKTGGMWSYYEVDDVKVLSAEHDAIYSPTTPLSAHHLCARCGCSTFGIVPDYMSEDAQFDEDGTPRSKKAGVNVRLLDDYALFTALTIETLDGRNLW